MKKVIAVSGCPICNEGVVTRAVKTARIQGSFHYVLPAFHSIGIQPLVLCQSMDHGHSTEAVTTDTFSEKMCLGLKSNLV